MANPWPVKTSAAGPGWFEVDDGVDCSQWSSEQAARRYAALPVILALVREACGWRPCVFCQEITHDPDCPGIAALKAAGEEIE